MLSGVPARKLLDALGQPGTLDAEDLGAAAVELRPFARHEGVARNFTLEAVHAAGKRECDPAERPGKPRGPVEARR